VLRADADAGAQQIERLKSRSARVVEEKRSLLGACQAAVDAVKEKEAEAAMQRRRVHREATEALELERKNFRAGQPQRLAKFLQSHHVEEKENMRRALQPEFARLRK
jgi:hypothetical protein